MPPRGAKWTARRPPFPSLPAALDRSVAELSARRYEFAAASLDGRLYFGGGNPGDGTATSTSFWDISSRVFLSPTLPTHADSHALPMHVLLGC